MRGDERLQEEMFSYGSLSQRVPQDHPLRRVRLLADGAMEELAGAFEQMYSRIGRPSVPPEQILRALLLQMLYTVRSERMLVEQMEYNLLFRWFPPQQAKIACRGPRSLSGWGSTSGSGTQPVSARTASACSLAT